MAENLLVRISVVRTKDARSSLTDEEVQSIWSKEKDVLKEVGGGLVLIFASYTDRLFRILSFPDLEAWNKYRKTVIVQSSSSLGMAKYWELDIDLGSEWTD